MDKIQENQQKNSGTTEMLTRNQMTSSQLEDGTSDSMTSRRPSSTTAPPPSQQSHVPPMMESQMAANHQPPSPQFVLPSSPLNLPHELGNVFANVGYHWFHYMTPRNENCRQDPFAGCNGLADIETTMGVVAQQQPGTSSSAVAPGPLSSNGSFGWIKKEEHPTHSRPVQQGHNTDPRVMLEAGTSSASARRTVEMVDPDPLEFDIFHHQPVQQENAQLQPHPQRNVVEAIEAAMSTAPVSSSSNVPSRWAAKRDHQAHSRATQQGRDTDSRVVLGTVKPTTSAKRVRIEEPQAHPSKDTRRPGYSAEPQGRVEDMEQPRGALQSHHHEPIQLEHQQEPTIVTSSHPINDQQPNAALPSAPIDLSYKVDDDFRKLWSRSDSQIRRELQEAMYNFGITDDQLAVLTDTTYWIVQQVLTTRIGWSEGPDLNRFKYVRFLMVAKKVPNKLREFIEMKRCSSHDLVFLPAFTGQPKEYPFSRVQQVRLKNLANRIRYPGVLDTNKAVREVNGVLRADGPEFRADENAVMHWYRRWLKANSRR